MTENRNSLPEDAAERKAAPMAEGMLWYFPNALAEVAKVSKVGNDQHNPGQPMHHARGKSSDHADCIVRHLIDAGKKDAKGVRHTAYLAWRALALLQEELERDLGLPLPRNARAPEATKKSEQKADADAWIEWPGGECPVEKDVPVDVRLRNGRVYTGLLALKDTCANSAFWKKHNMSNDIVAYRLARP